MIKGDGMATPTCPQCGSERVWKDGVRYLADGSVIQRWLCRDCGYRFSDPSKTSKRKNLHNFYRRVGGWEDQPKNSAKAVEALKELEETEKRAAGATEKSTEADVKGKILEFAWWMKKHGYSEATIERRTRLLITLVNRGANILNPESVKDTIAKQDGWSLRTKVHAVDVYTCFLKMLGRKWEPPRYKPVKKLPFIPLEEELDALISGCNKKTAAFLQLLKETGMRAGEAWRLEWIDVDFENRLVKVTPEKCGEPRTINVSNKLLAMLNALPKVSHKVFNGSLRHFARSFRRQRARIAHKASKSTHKQDNISYI
ncbi:hypothetical protein DRO19_03655 [Candidatus Bathyarchaeota archaeon]|nr:MAG: hypothetical protein DRO19_03655 [Candidatus Bathyarchaeota archaeon]